METFKDYIKETRTLSALDQKEFGKQFNVTNSTVSHWESGWLPSKKNLRNIAEFYSIPITTLVKKVINQTKKSETE